MPGYTRLELEKLENFQVAEQLCRTLAYQYDKIESKSKLALKTKQGIQQCDVQKFTTYSHLAPEAKKRARGMIVIPQMLPEEDETVPIWFTWTGTNSAQSMLADLAEVNAGEHSYRLLEKQFLEQSLKAIRKAKRRFPGKKIELHFTGHSLGGALAQLHFATLERAIAQSIALESLDNSTKNHFKHQDRLYLNNLKEQGSLEGITSEELASIVQTDAIDVRITSRDIASFELHPWNATGVIQATAFYTKKLIQDNAHRGIPSRAEHVIFLGDPIQQTGTSNIFSDPAHQDITLLEIGTSIHPSIPKIPTLGAFGIISTPIESMVNAAYHAVKKHTGRLSLPNGELNTKQDYRILTSQDHPQAIIDHLLTHKSHLIEIAKSIQPMFFSQIHVMTIEKLVDILYSPSKIAIAKEALERFITARLQNMPIQRLKPEEQLLILNAMLKRPTLFESMDRLFLQAGTHKDMDSVFDVAILQKFVSSHPASSYRHKLFDRIVSRMPVGIREEAQHMEKTESVIKELKSKVIIHMPQNPSPKKKV